MAYAKDRRLTPFALLLAGVLLVVVQTKFYGRAFVVPPVSGGRILGSPATHSPSFSRSGSDEFGMGSAIPVASLLAIAAATSRFQTKRLAPAPAVVATAPFAGASITTAEVEEPLVIMRGAGGRRQRLGVGGKICMLTGTKKYKGYVRNYWGSKSKRYWKPNIKWRKVWWEREKKWVSLYITQKALRRIDIIGLEGMCKKAGLDLYAWCKPHWEAGSRQPLSLKVGRSSKANRDRKRWPLFEDKLNQGRPMADLMPGPHAWEKPLKWSLRRTYKNRHEHEFVPIGKMTGEEKRAWRKSIPSWERKRYDTEQPWEKDAAPAYTRPSATEKGRLQVTLPGMIAFSDYAARIKSGS